MDQIRLGRMLGTPEDGDANGSLPQFSCHCGPQMVRGQVQYYSFNEDEASGRVPVQVSSTGDYPGPRDMGIDVIDTHDCDTTYQRVPGSVKMSG